jgi:alginate O-acetyltransferase complex protein AlgI
MPYLSRNIAEFEKKWHIFISSWLRTYSYTNLARNQGPTLLKKLRIAFVFHENDFWHPVKRTFILWGFVYALFVLYQKIKDLISERLKYHKPHNFIGSNYIPLVLPTFSLTCLIFAFFSVNHIKPTFIYTI